MNPRKVLPAAALIGFACCLSACSNEGTQPTAAALDRDDLIARGKYLVAVMSCTDCHTPGMFSGAPDETRYLGGSEVGFEMPGLGVFYGPNLTPDDETGLGTWSEEEIVAAITKGERPDGRLLAPIMPVASFSKLTAEDAKAVAAYLKSMEPVKNKVLGPYGPGQTPEGPFFRVIVPQGPAVE